ncbi:MAG: hypothetical protein ACYCT1_14000 [Steroidobacteraceae bacterium]
MKATIDIPEGLYRKVKAKSALLGHSVREVTIELYRQWLGETPAATPADSPEAWLDAWLADADAAARDAPPGPSAREMLEADRKRLEPR